MSARTRARAKTAASLLALAACAVPALALVGVAELRLALKPARRARPVGAARTVLLTGGKMTKALQLARMFDAVGCRVVLAETRKYRFCGARFSRSVDRFVTLPDFRNDGADYAAALARIARTERVGVFVPVASPAAALYDARALPGLPCDAFSPDEATVRMLDDKHAFCAACHRLGLSAPEVYRIESADELLAFDFSGEKRYVLKSIPYDSVHRLDARTLPHPGWQDRVRSLRVSPAEPWVLQEFVEGREVCTHSTVRDGEIELYICSDSSPFQVNYAMVDLPAVHAWVEAFVGALGLTGQVSFDFIVRADGAVMPIECNPRTHSAITLFHDQPDAAEAYLRPAASGLPERRPHPTTRPTFWLYHELWRLATARDAAERARIVRRAREGHEAVFRWDDPLPFLMLNHVQIPILLLNSLLAGRGWTRIDFNIGKLVEPGGD